MLNSLIAEAVKAHARTQGITPGELARLAGCEGDVLWRYLEALD